MSFASSPAMSPAFRTSARFHVEPMPIGAGSGVALVWVRPWMPSFEKSTGMPRRVSSTNHFWTLRIASTCLENGKTRSGRFGTTTLRPL